jgi:L-tartrate/succinate antiporter
MNTKTAVTPPVANQASNGNAKRLLMMALPVIVAVLLLAISAASGFLAVGVLKKSQPADLLR